MIDILQSNNILTEEARKFIKQDAVSLFENVPSLTHKVASFFTDLGARFNREINGEGFKLKKYIAPQKRRAKQLGMHWVQDIVLSPLKHKKYRVLFNDGKHIDYGAANMSDFLIHKDENRRNRFHQRFHNNEGYNDPRSGLFYSRYLLW